MTDGRGIDDTSGTTPGAVPADIRVTGGSPSTEELAAVTAVLSAALAQLSAEDRSEDPGTSAWDRSRRAPRRPPIAGGWNDWSS